ncbi:MAG: PRC-barrel domain-containing protein [Chloroflexota bacterium]
MELKEGTNVYTAGGDKVGEIGQVVIRPDTKQITHVIVQRGFLFTEDKVVPMHLVEDASEGAVRLTAGVQDLDAFQNFEETAYVYVDERPKPLPAIGHPVPSLYWYPPYGARGLDEAGLDYDTLPVYVQVQRENIPEDAVALKEGARVISSDGKHVGDVELVFADPANNRATHVVVSKGLLVKEKKVLPTWWMAYILEDEIYLSVEAGLVEKLPEYQPQA